MVKHLVFWKLKEEAAGNDKATNAKLVKEKTGFNGDLVFNASKPDGTMRKLTDPSKIHQLGWHHQIEIDEGIQRLYNWYTSY